jgi:small-conductance mechanosensitive channel
MEIKNIFENFLAEKIIFLIHFTPKLLFGILVVFAIFHGKKYFDKLIIKILKKSLLTKSHQNLYLTISKVAFIFISLISFFFILGFKSIVAGIFAGGGITTIVLGFALREIGENFVAGLLLNISKPFKIGDVIECLKYTGEVISIELRYTQIKTFSGKYAYIPSSIIYKNPLINYTKNNIRRFDFTIGISYQDDLRKAYDLVTQELKEVEGILLDPAPNCIIDQLSPYQINLKILMWIDINGTQSPAEVKKSAITKIKEKLIKEKFNLGISTIKNLEE